MAALVFLFGKLPAHGDFVARGLGPVARRGWDEAGSAMMEALRQAAGEGLDRIHPACPPWRFVTEGEDGWRAGALAASVDAVGRRFLLTVGVDGLQPQVAGAAGLALAAEAEAVIYQALGARLDADAALASAAQRIEAMLDEAGAAAAMLAAQPLPPGVWWTAGSPDQPPLALRAGPPPADLLARTALAFSSLRAAS